MKLKRIELSYIIMGFFVIYIFVLCLIIINTKKDNEVVSLNDENTTIEFLVSGTYDNVGCLSVYIDNNDEGNEYSFNSGSSWQKSNYGAIYRNGKTILLIRNKNKEIIYQKAVNVTSIIDDAPVIHMDFDKSVGSMSEKDLLKNISTTMNGKSLDSNIKVDILDQVDDEVLVSYLANVSGKKCYLVRNANIVPIATPTPSPTPINTPKPTITPKPITAPKTSSEKWVWPLSKPYNISQYFKANKHNGIDIYGPKRGSAIYAARDGVVTDITHNSTSGYYVTIKHSDGYYTRYAHMQNIYGKDKLGSKGSATKYIKVGDQVTVGSQIGEIGSSGRSTGVHLHFEIWNGKPFKSTAFNPLNFYK